MSEEESELVKSLRKKIGILSADRDCLRCLLSEEKKKAEQELTELRTKNEVLQTRLSEIVALVNDLRKHLAS